MKKVIFVNSSLTDGGSEKVMTLLANYMANNDYDVTMILVRNKKKTYILDEKINCIQLEYNSKNKLYILITRIVKLRKLFKSIKADTIISFMVDINCFTLLANVGLGSKVIISERANPFIRKKISTKLGEYFLYPLTDKIVFQTDMVKDYFGRKLNEKSVVIPNPINISLQYNEIVNRNKTIIAAGRFTEQKNFKMLIDAFNRFSKEYVDYNLYIYGDGPLKAQLMQYVAKLEAANNIHFPGYIDNINEIMRYSSIYVSSSNYEGISNSMLEALALGVPSICTDCPVGGARMVIQNDKNGILIPVGDSDALFYALRKIARDQVFSESLSKEAIKIKSKFSMKAIAEKWIDII